jgi:predicted Zn-dependent protease
LGKSKLSQDQQVVAMVRKVGNRIALAANKPEYEWEFNVIHVGLILMAKAGYDPSKASDFWKRMAAKKGKKSPPEFLSTHPADNRRIEQIEKWLPEAMEYYRPASHLR